MSTRPLSFLEQPPAPGDVIGTLPADLLPQARVVVRPRIYRGRTIAGGLNRVTVEVDKFVRDLDPRFDLANHSPSGFNWGYQGSGPAQLALALLADATADDERALRHYQAFKLHFVAALKQDEQWETDDVAVRALVATIEGGC
jgi:hypothetical protein